MLADLLSGHLDPGYAAAARRRAAAGPAAPRRPAVRRGLAALTAVLLLGSGALLAVAYQQTRVRAPQLARAHAQLVTEIARRSQQTDALQAAESRLRAALATERDQALANSAAGVQAASLLHDLEVATGLVGARGPGLTVTVADGRPPGNPVGGAGGSPGPDLSRVSDRDLQGVVNALWAAGAEAVAVNGQRLGALSTIRSAGEAVLIDFRPVVSPYTVVALGDPTRMDAAFAVSTAARRFETYVQLYGMTFQVHRGTDLSVPAAAAPTLAYAAPPPTPTPTSTSTSTPTSTSTQTPSATPTASPSRR